jgi:hypothetical protein
MLKIQVTLSLSLVTPQFVKEINIFVGCAAKNYL